MFITLPKLTVNKNFCEVYIYKLEKFKQYFIYILSTNNISYIFSVPIGTCKCCVRGSGTRESEGLKPLIYNITSNYGFVYFMCIGPFIILITEE